jgi:hypothetical protein
MSTSAISCCPADLMKKVSLQYYLYFTMVTSHGSTCTLYMYYSSPAVIQFFSKGASIRVIVQYVQSFCGAAASDMERGAQGEPSFYVIRTSTM